MGLATFVFKMQMYNNEELAISFKNLTANAELKYLLSDEDLSASDAIVAKTNNNGVDLTNNLTIQNSNNKKYLYISFRVGFGQTSASVEDIQIEHNSTATTYEQYVKDKIFIKNNDVYEEFEKKDNYKDILIAYNAQTQNILANTVTELNLTAIESNSSKLSIVNNKVIVGKDINLLDCVFNLSTWRRDNSAYLHQEKWS